MNSSDYKFVPSPYPPKTQVKQVVVDPTLTKEGYAADAKVTGDKLALKLDTDVTDGKSISLETLNSDKRLEIAGFIDAGFNKFPIKDSDGNIKWVDAVDAETVAELKTRVNNLYNVVIPAINTNITNLQTELAQAETNITALNTRVTKNESDILENKNSIEENRQNIEINKNNIIALRTELTTKINELQIAVNELNSAIDLLQTEIASIKTTYATIAYVDSQINALRTELNASIRYEVEQLNTRITEINTTLHNDISALSQRVDTLDNKLTTEITRVLNVLSSLDERVTHNESRLNSHKKSIDFLNANAVTVEPQTWTDAEKLQARKNIGAISESEVPIPPVIDEILERLSTVEQSIVVLNTELEAVSTTATEAKTIATEAKTIATSASTKADEAKSKADSADTKATQALTKAETALSNSTTAISTANSAKETADAASEKVDELEEELLHLDCGKLESSTVFRTLQLKRGTYEVLTRLNLVFSEGEAIFELDTNKLKIGDGVNHYNDLPYISGGTELSADGTSIIIENNTIKLNGFNSASNGYIPYKESGILKWREEDSAITNDMIESICQL